MLFSKKKDKIKQEKQMQIDNLVKEIKEGMHTKGIFSGSKHLELSMLDYEKAFELFDEAMLSHVKFVID